MIAFLQLRKRPRPASVEGKQLKFRGIRRQKLFAIGGRSHTPHSLGRQRRLVALQVNQVGALRVPGFIAYREDPSIAKPARVEMFHF